MVNSKKGVSIIALIIALICVIVLGAVMVGSIQKNDPFKDIEESEIIEDLKSLQAKLEIKKLATFTKLGKNVDPDNEEFGGIFKKIDNTEYYEVDKSEYSKMKKQGKMYLTKDYQYIYISEKGDIYPKSLSISGMQITNKVPEGYTAINTVEELQNITGEGKYILMSDINLENFKFKPIKDFAGILDGNGHKIYNLSYKSENYGVTLDEWKDKIYYPSIDKMLEIDVGSSKAQNNKYIRKINRVISNQYSDNVYKLEAAKNSYTRDGYALFENTLKGSLIRNLTIENFSIAANNCVAGLVQVLGGELKNITAKNVNVVGLQRVGTLAGMSSGQDVTKIASCIVTNEVKNNVEAVTFAGGIIGDAIYTDIINCKYDGIASMIMADMAGGAIAGSSIGGELRNLEANSQIISLNGKYKNNYSWLGGIVGYAKNSNLNHCIATDINIYSNTSKMKNVGGVAGSIVDCNVINSYAKGRISNVNSYSGGLIGTVDISEKENIEIKDSYANVDISSLDKVCGGFIGTIRNISDKSNRKVEIEKCYSLGNINTAVAGAGFISWVDSNINILNSYTKSNINVRIKDEAGFIVKLDSKKANIVNTYSYGYINGGNSCKYISLVDNKDNVKLKNCYYDLKDNATKNEYGVGIKTDNMNRKESFKGFDFRNVWTTKTDTVTPELI